ncbi:Dot/Icm type IV secretion system effector CoxTRP1 [Coxiella burnetii]|uniref:Dot/Icm type IV secretion system effector CoxTRP1 n=1 Tax=Coxiella burnetii TaxID=777 RepID=UPI00222FCCA4|nr:Dot/Icm type IV secretion system effector CoxTRP1 [Coxiella burnetii]
MPYPYEANLNDAKRLLKDRRYPEAALQFYKAATQGSREAWEILNGEILFEEQGFEDDVNNGDHDYQLCIALIHLIGLGVPRDDKRAYDILQCLLADEEKLSGLSERRNEALIHTYYLIGFLYQGGRGIKRNDEEAVRWYCKAAEAGLPAAMQSLGVAYSEGLGVVRNDKEAFDWFRRAAEEGNSAAMMRLGMMYEEGLGVTGGQRTTNRFRAIYWFVKALEKPSDHERVCRYITANLLNENKSDMRLARALLSETAENLKTAIERGIKRENAIFSQIVTELDQGEFSFASETSSKKLKELFNLGVQTSLFYTLLKPLQRTELLATLILKRHEAHRFLTDSQENDFSDIALLIALQETEFWELEPKTFNQLATIVLSHINSEIVLASKNKNHKTQYLQYLWPLTESLWMGRKILDDNNKFLFISTVLAITLKERNQKELTIDCFKTDPTPFYLLLNIHASREVDRLINPSLDEEKNDEMNELYTVGLLKVEEQRLKNSNKKWLEGWRSSLKEKLELIDEQHFNVWRGQEILTQKGIKKFVPEGIAGIYNSIQSILATQFLYNTMQRKFYPLQNIQPLLQKIKKIASEHKKEREGFWGGFKSTPATFIYKLVNNINFPDEIIYEDQSKAEISNDDFKYSPWPPRTSSPLPRCPRAGGNNEGAGMTDFTYYLWVMIG